MENPKSAYLRGLYFNFHIFNLTGSWMCLFIMYNIYEDLGESILVEYPGAEYIINHSIVKLFNGIWITFTK